MKVEVCMVEMGKHERKRILRMKIFVHHLHYIGYMHLHPIAVPVTLHSAATAACGGAVSSSCSIVRDSSSSWNSAGLSNWSCGKCL